MRTIPMKETLEIEFKSDEKCYPDHDLIEEIVGMTNTVGGTLYLGVEDDGSITGVHQKHKDAVGVTALIANNTVPPIAVRAEIITEVYPSASLFSIAKENLYCFRNSILSLTWPPILL